MQAALCRQHGTRPCKVQSAGAKVHVSHINISLQKQSMSHVKMWDKDLASLTNGTSTSQFVLIF